MATDRANDLHAFRSFIDQQLEQGGPLPTLDEALARWEYENASEEEREEARAAIGRVLRISTPDAFGQSRNLTANSGRSTG